MGFLQLHTLHTWKFINIILFLFSMPLKIKTKTLYWLLNQHSPFLFLHLVYFYAAYLQSNWQQCKFFLGTDSFGAICWHKWWKQKHWRAHLRVKLICSMCFASVRFRIPFLFFSNHLNWIILTWFSCLGSRIYSFWCSDNSRCWISRVLLGNTS